MRIYGYHRVSTKEQKEDRGEIEITRFCDEHNLPLEKIYVDKVSGKEMSRLRYTVLKEDILRPGDILIIAELDRLARRKKDIIEELNYFKKNNIRVMILEIPTTLQSFDNVDNELAKIIIETIDNMLIEMYAAFAQAEMEKREKRQRDGIEAMKMRGEWDKYGRKRIEKPENWNDIAEQWQKGEITAVQAMKLTGLKKSTFYKFVKEDGLQKIKK